MKFNRFIYLLVPHINNYCLVQYVKIKLLFFQMYHKFVVYSLFIHIFCFIPSNRECINQLFSSSRGVFGTTSGNSLHVEGTSTLRRSSSMRRAQGVSAAGIKRRSLPLQVKYHMVRNCYPLEFLNIMFIKCINLKILTCAY